MRRAAAKLLFSKIGVRLAAGFVVLLLMVASLAYYSSVSGRASLAEGVGLASEAIAESMSKSMDTIIYLKGFEVLMLMTSEEMLDELNASNAAFDAMEDPQTYIDQMDENWSSAPLDVIPESMQEVLDNDISTIIATHLADPHYLAERGMDIFGEVILTNKYGAVIGATSRVSDYRQNDEAWWQDAPYGDVRILDISYDESSDYYGVAACVGVTDDKGDLAGVAKAVINIFSIAKDIELTALGYETSELKITTADGRLIFSSRAFVMFQDVSLNPFFVNVDTSRGHFSVMEGDTERLFSYVTSEGYLDYQGHGWLVFLSHSSEEVLGPATELTKRIITVAALALVLGALIAVALSRSVTRPIAELEDATRSMARGELGRRIPATRNDELGRLARSFNDMASDLDLMYTDLDKLVKERTEELEKLNKKLGVLASITRHDALNQVTVQKGWLGMAMEVSDENEDVNRYLRKMQETTDNLVSFFNFTSEYEGLGSNKPEWQGVTEALESATTGLDLSQVKLNVDLEGAEVFADPMFPKVLHNLIGNSLKHGREVSEISLSYSEGTEGLMLTYEDDGIGIPLERKETIFERESGTSSHGMFLSAEILRLTNISIRETGVEGEGARFEMLIPEGRYRLARRPSRGT